jgi:hypothetical protein
VTAANRGRWLAAAAAIFVALPPLLLVFWIRANVVNIPFWDEWDETPLVIAFHHGVLTFADIWTPHNEHRVLTMRLTLLGLDAILHQWSPVSEILVSIAVAVATLGGLIVLAYRTLPERAALLLSCIFSLVVFSLNQYENWVWGFQVAWFYVNAALVWAIVCLTNPRRPVLSTIGAVALCSFATASMASGLVVWAACAVVIALRPDRLRRLSVWIPVMAVAAYVYFSGFPVGGVLASHDAGYLLSAASYALTYLTVPMFGSFGISGAATIGWFVGIGLIALAIGLARDRDRARFSRTVPWLGLIAFAVADAAITGYGRAALGIGQAGSSRYTTVSQCAWIGLVAIAAVYFPAIALRWRIVILAGAFAAAVSFASEQPAAWNALVGSAQALAIARSGLASGTATDVDLNRIYPKASVERAYAEELRSVGEGPLSATPVNR